MGLSMMLKALGIEIPPEQIPVITDVILKLPQHVAAVGNYLKDKVASFDARQDAIEKRLAAIEEKLDGPGESTGGIIGNHTRAGTDASFGISADDTIRG